jgi:hypothetical protein
LSDGLGVPTDRQSKLQELPKLLDGEAGVARDTAHGDGVDWVVAGNGEDARAVAHDDVLALAQHDKPCLLERPDCIEVIDAGELGQD